MRIHCPFCGERDSSEFTVSGDASVRRLDAGSAHEPQRFLEAVYLRDNPAGRHVELWYHSSGCRSWLAVTRDTRTHEIYSVALASEASRS